MSKLSPTLKRNQQGDMDSGMLIIAILLSLFLFKGEPDVWDKLHAWAMSIQPMEQRKP